MGYGFYYGYAMGPDGQAVKRPEGYGVRATCDKRGCINEIDRGLGYLCGDDPHGPFDAAPGCGRYYCGDHISYVGPRGGCQHRGKIAWGRTLACMAEEKDADGAVITVCLFREGHTGPHAWDAFLDPEERQGGGAMSDSIMLVAPHGFPRFATATKWAADAAVEDATQDLPDHLRPRRSSMNSSDGNLSPLHTFDFSYLPDGDERVERVLTALGRVTGSA